MTPRQPVQEHILELVSTLTRKHGEHEIRGAHHFLHLRSFRFTSVSLTEKQVHVFPGSSTLVLSRHCVKGCRRCLPTNCDVGNAARAMAISRFRFVMSVSPRSRSFTTSSTCARRFTRETHLPGPAEHVALLARCCLCRKVFPPSLPTGLTPLVSAPRLAKKLGATQSLPQERRRVPAHAQL